MLQIKSVLQNAKKRLADAGITTCFLDAELLLAHGLEKSREYVIGYPEAVITKEEFDNFNKMLEKRASRQPLAQITGKKEFWGREFTVTVDTLAPRPDSETLVEAVKSLFPDDAARLKILDLGTGSGCLVLTILAEYCNATGVAVDASEAALAVAKTNAGKLGLAKRCGFVLSNWTEAVQGKFDLIISNPPYIKDSDITTLDKEVSVYEPYMALAGGGDGLESYRLIAPCLKNLLNKNGYAVFEFGMGQHPHVKGIMENSGLNFINFYRDLAGITRCLSVTL